MHIIKQIPEDFLVWEIPSFKLVDSGSFALFWLRKKDYNTLDAVRKIAFQLKISPKKIGWAGNKDRLAVTEQVISIQTKRTDLVGKVKLREIDLRYIGQSDKPVSLGDLGGNRFLITVRKLPHRVKLKSPKSVLNLFGPQRFSKNNVDIGRSLVKRNFRKAVELVDQKIVLEYIDDHPGDYIGAFRQLPLKLRKLFVHAYQSFLWNLSVEELLKLKLSPEFVPVVGFGFEFKNDQISSVIRKILRKEQITARDFIIKQFPEISSEGSNRPMFISPKDFNARLEGDELNIGFFKALVSFSLEKSCYATVVIDYLFQ